MISSDLHSGSIIPRGEIRDREVRVLGYANLLTLTQSSKKILDPSSL